MDGFLIGVSRGGSSHKFLILPWPRLTMSFSIPLAEIEVLEFFESGDFTERGSIHVNYDPFPATLARYYRPVPAWVGCSSWVRQTAVLSFHIIFFLPTVLL